MADRNMVVRIDDNYVGPFDAVGHPIKFQKTPAEVRKCSPLLGEDTASVLRELGYTEEEIKAMFPGMDVLCDKLSLGIACHTGEGALGVGCSCKPRK